MWYYILLALLIYRLYAWFSHKRWVGHLHTKYVFITGSDGGFGKSTVKSLYRRGVPVFAGCRSKEGAERLRQEIGDDIQTIQVDVTDTKSIERAYKDVCDKLPSGAVLWAVINNAGVTGLGGPLEFLTRADFQSVMEVNCLGAVEVSRIFLPLIKKSRGRIINMSSTAAELAPGTSPYVISKVFTSAFSNGLRLEKAQWGINVCTIEPAMYKTKIIDVDAYKANATKQWNNLDEEIRKEYGEEFFERVLSSTCKTFETYPAQDLTPVIEAYEHALFARKPYHLYTPGNVSTIIYLLANYCPAFIIDKICLSLFHDIMPEASKNKAEK